MFQINLQIIKVTAKDIHDSGNFLSSNVDVFFFKITVLESGLREPDDSSVYVPIGEVWEPNLFTVFLCVFSQVYLLHP